MHLHLNNEELAIAIDGGLALRTPAGERPLDRGEVVSFACGEDGAHQIINRSEVSARFLIVSEMNVPDIVFRPESGSVVAFGRAPGSDRDSGYTETFMHKDAVDMWEVEAPPPRTPPQ